MSFTEGTLPPHPRPHLTHTHAGGSLLGGSARPHLVSGEGGGDPGVVGGEWRLPGVSEAVPGQARVVVLRRTAIRHRPAALRPPAGRHHQGSRRQPETVPARHWPPSADRPRLTCARAAGRRTSSAGTRTRPATTSSAASAGTATACPSSSRSIRCSASRVRRTEREREREREREIGTYRHRSA